MIKSMGQQRRLIAQLSEKANNQLEAIKKRRPELADVINEIIRQRGVSWEKKKLKNESID